MIRVARFSCLHCALNLTCNARGKESPVRQSGMDYPARSYSRQTLIDFSKESLREAAGRAVFTAAGHGESALPGG